MWWEIPGHLEVEDGKLLIGGLKASAIAEQYSAHEIPVFVFNLDRVSKNYDRFLGAMREYTDRDVEICYAMKSNNNPHIMRTVINKGSGIEAISPMEVHEALNKKCPPKKIVYNGTGVSNHDIEELLKCPDIMINVDSFSELRRLYKQAYEKSLLPMDISFRLNPGRGGAGVHWKTITAGPESHDTPIKFGIEEGKILEAYRLAKDDYGFNPVGIHMHVGSGWLTSEEVKEYLSAVDVLLGKAGEICEFLGRDLDFINFGGGPSIRYRKEDQEFPLDDYARETCGRIEASPLNPKTLLFEPGRYLVGDAGLLLVEVNTVEEKNENIFVYVNTGMNNNIRVPLYNAYHEVVPCDYADSELEEEVTIAGNICETGDVLAKRRRMPRIKEGNKVAVLGAGAYCQPMQSEYGMRPHANEVVIEDGVAKLTIG